MATRTTVRSELANRLGDPSFVVWTTAELNGYIDNAIKGLYPSFYQRKVATSTAAAGPLQTPPAGARNIYLVGLQRTGSTRVRPLRQWAEGALQVFVPKTGITGDVLVWGWTEGWDSPASDTEVLGIPRESEEVVILRAQVVALEKLLTNSVSAEKYFATQVREAHTDEDISLAIDAIHSSLRERLATVVPLPEVRQ